MLTKHVFGYLPSLIVPALTAFGAIYFYTRLLSPAEFGYYTLVISAMNLLNAVFFNWLQVSLPRLTPRLSKEGRLPELQVTANVAFTAVCVILVMLALVTGLLVKNNVFPLNHNYLILWLAVPLSLARSLLNMNQAFHRSNLNFRRYNIIECGQAILGLGIGVSLVFFLATGSVGAIWGMIAGMTAMVLVDARTIISVSLKYFSKSILGDIVAFGIPLILTYGLAFIISQSDRFLIEYFRNPSEVGVYAAGYSLMDRISSIIFLVVAVPSYPLTIHRLEHEGVAAARKQTHANGIALLGMAMPACVGLILSSPQLGAVLIGPGFRADAVRLMPIIAVAAILNGFATHYFDHAFHLAKRPYKLIYTQGPTALFNLAANLYLIPRYGYMGAAYSTLASYVLQLILSIAVGRGVFPISFPFKVAAQVAISVAAMAGALLVARFPANLTGLFETVTLGSVVYAASLVILDVHDIRSKVLGYLKLGKSR